MFNSIKSISMPRRLKLELEAIRDTVSLARQITSFYNFVDSVGGDKELEKRLLVEYMREKAANPRVYADEVQRYIKVRSFILCILHDNVE